MPRMFGMPKMPVPSGMKPEPKKPDLRLIKGGKKEPIGAMSDEELGSAAELRKSSSERHTEANRSRERVNLGEVGSRTNEIKLTEEELKREIDDVNAEIQKLLSSIGDERALQGMSRINMPKQSKVGKYGEERVDIKALLKPTAEEEAFSEGHPGEEFIDQIRRIQQREEILGAKLDGLRKRRNELQTELAKLKEAPIELGDEDIEEVIEEAPKPSKRPPPPLPQRRPPPPPIREAA